MNILHYSLGLPPYRSGGLTKYSVDLMITQVQAGHHVSLLYPGSFSLKSRISKNRKYKGIQVFELKRPTPVPLLDGVKEPIKLIPNTSDEVKNSIRTLLNNEKPQIIHLHTLMGLPDYLLIYAKELGIKICYTTHDYFGICLRVNLIDANGHPCEGPSPSKCATCNKNGKSAFQMNLRNLKVLHQMKRLIRKVKPNPDSKIRELTIIHKENQCSKTQEYNNLMNNYKRTFSLIDLFLFNSSVSQSVYSQLLPTHNGIIVPISHRAIKFNNNKDNGIKRTTKIHLLYIGSSTPYKGLPLLINILDQIYSEGITNIHLEIWGTETTFQRKYISTKGYYNSAKQHEQIYKEKDLLICPSICNETFGFVVLESLSQQVPALVSNTVGAKDIINTIDPYFVFQGETDLKEKLISICQNKDKLTAFRSRLNKSLLKDFEMEKHTQEILKIYTNIPSLIQKTIRDQMH